MERALSGYVRRPRKAREIMAALYSELSAVGFDEVALPLRDVAQAAGASPSSVALSINRLRNLGMLRLTGGGEWVALPGGRPGQRMPYRYRAQWPVVAPSHPVRRTPAPAAAPAPSPVAASGA